MQAIQRSQEIHRRLTDLILEGHGLAAIPSALSELIDRPVAITDAWGFVVASTGWDDINELTAVFSNLASQSGANLGLKPSWFESSSVWISPILSRFQKAVDGYLIISDSSKELDQFDLEAMEQAAFVAALELSTQRAVVEAERRLKRDFIDDLLGGNHRSTEALLARARSLGWDLVGKRVVVLVDLDCFEQYTLAHIGRGEEFIQQIKDRFLDSVTRVVLERNPSAILVDRSDSIIALPHFTPPTAPSQARREVQLLAQTICDQAQEQLDELTIIGYTDYAVRPIAV